MVYNQNNLNPEFNIRRSQLLAPFGVGALLDINNQSVMVADSEYWSVQKCKKIHDIRLETEMKANGFIEPPIKEEKEAIVGIRFPKWYFSPNDRVLKTIDAWRDMAVTQRGDSVLNRFNKKPYDPRNKGTELVPVRIVCACKHGHAQDFPWLEWPHTNIPFEEFKNHEITLESVSQTGSISDLKVKCKTCGKSKSLTGIFDEENFPNKLKEVGIQCKGQYVWKKEDSEGSCREGNRLRVILKNANNFFFPNISSSVNIPFPQNRLLERIQECTEYLTLELELKSVSTEEGMEKLESNEKVNTMIRYISENLDCTQEEVKNEISIYFFDRKIRESTGDIMDYRRPEFNVLMGNETYDKESERFKIQIFEQSKFPISSFKKKISKIALVHQLEVVSALRSYSRINSTDSELMKEQALDGEEVSNGVEVSLKRKDGYYVGMRSLGEGIFIAIDTEQLYKWKQQIIDTSICKRIFNKEKNVRFENEFTYINPEYYLIHTLSHLLIRELSLSSGYSSSALKERIYFSNDSGEEMYGILIYTSSSDSEGTLGGLVKQGVPERLFDLIRSAIEKAQWCSFDPICNESDSQGRDSLNAAACHACSLISETSCEKMNVFLDRSVLIGTIDNPGWGFFSDI